MVAACCSDHVNACKRHALIRRRQCGRRFDLQASVLFRNASAVAPALLVRLRLDEKLRLDEETRDALGQALHDGPSSGTMATIK